MKQLKKNKRPVVLTVKGKAAAIVQDAEAYQRLLDIAAYADAEEVTMELMRSRVSPALVAGRTREDLRTAAF